MPSTIHVRRISIQRLVAILVVLLLVEVRHILYHSYSFCHGDLALASGADAKVNDDNIIRRLRQLPPSPSSSSSTTPSRPPPAPSSSLPLSSPSSPTAALSSPSSSSSLSPSVTVVVTVWPGETKEAKTWAWAASSFGIKNYILVTYDVETYTTLSLYSGGDDENVVLVDDSHHHVLSIHQDLVSKGVTAVFLNAKKDLLWVEQLPRVLDSLVILSSSEGGYDVVFRQDTHHHQEVFAVYPTSQGQAYLTAIIACRQEHQEQEQQQQEQRQQALNDGDEDIDGTKAVERARIRRGLITTMMTGDGYYARAVYDDMLREVSLPASSSSSVGCLFQHLTITTPTTKTYILPPDLLISNPRLVDVLIHRALQQHELPSPTSSSSSTAILHVVISVTNPAGFDSRYIRVREFINRIERWDSRYVQLYLVELAYEGGDDNSDSNPHFNLTQSDNPRHLQLRASDMMWHKENLINIGVRKLLPSDWKAMAWIDAELEFESPTWALDALKILTSGCRDVVQLFTHGLNLDARGVAFGIEGGNGFFYSQGRPYQRKWGPDWWHPGYAWALSRDAYDMIGGLYQYNILGSGDEVHALSFLGFHASMDSPKTLRTYVASPGHHQHIIEWEKNTRRLRIGYVPGIVKHHFHGEREKRGYNSRRDILLDMAYDPHVHVKPRDGDGLLVPTEAFPPDALAKIRDYFQSRDEDEGFRGRKTGDKESHPIKQVLTTHEPLDDKLHVIMLIPPVLPPHLTCEDFHFGCMRQGREGMIKASLERTMDDNYLDNEGSVELYLVEVAIGDMPHSGLIQPESNPRHLLLRSEVPQYHKEKLVNLAVEKLLPGDWKAMAWVDGDVTFVGNPNWATDTLRLLNGGYDTVQLFSHAMDVDDDGRALKYYSGFGYHHVHGHPYGTDNFEWWHPGYGWAWSREAYETRGQLFEGCIYGGGSSVQAWALAGFHANPPIQSASFPYINEFFRDAILEYEQRIQSSSNGGIKLGYVPGMIQRNQAFQDELEAVGRPLTKEEHQLQRQNFRPGNHMEAFPLTMASPSIRGHPAGEGMVEEEEESTVIPSVPSWQQPMAPSPSVPRIAILVPFAEDQSDALLEALSSWHEAGPACASMDSSTRKGLSLLFYSNLSPSSNSTVKLDEHVKQMAHLSTSVLPCFDEVATIYADLTPEQDGYPSGPNFMFFKLTMENLSSEDQEHLGQFTHVLWMERDVVPIRQYWIDAVVREAMNMVADDLWVKGSLFHGTRHDKKVMDGIALMAWVNHMNGNAMYKLHDPRFRAFLEVVQEREPPGDYWKCFDISIGKTLMDLPYSWPIHQNLYEHFAYSRIIWNGCQYEDIDPTTYLPDHVYLVHHCANTIKGGPSSTFSNLAKKFDGKGKPTQADAVIYYGEIRPDHELSIYVVCEGHEVPLAGLAMTSARQHIKNAAEFVVVVPKAVYPEARKGLLSFIKVIPDDEFHNHKQKISMIMKADLYTKGRFVLHLHPDSVLFRKLLYKDIFLFQKPLIQFDLYSNLPNPEIHGPVQEAISKMLKRPIEYEYSLANRHMNVYPRNVYSDFRDHLQTLHEGSSINYIVLEHEDIFTSSDASFNLLGAYLYYQSPESVSWNYAGATFDPYSSALDPAFRVNRPPLLCQGYGPWAYQQVGNKEGTSAYGKLIEAIRKTASGKTVSSREDYCEGISKLGIPVSY